MALLKIYLISFIAFLSINTNAQIASKNLVKNHSFDEYLDCPNYFAKYRGTISQCRYWYNLYNGSPDYFHSCSGPGEPFYESNGIPYGAGYQYPKTGEGMSGILLYVHSDFFIKNLREYITGELKSSLQIDSTYCFEMYCNRTYRKYINIYSHSIGALFATDLIFDTLSGNSSVDTVSKIPQVSNSTVLIEDTLGWTKIAQQFIATDTFRYFTIGNFEPDITTWISVYDSSEWLNMSYVFIDDVAVYKGKCREEEKPQKTFFNLYPNPGSGVFSLNYGVEQDAQLVVYDILGRTVLNETLAADKVLHHFSMQQYSNGMYFLKVLGANNDEELYSQKFLLQR
jgi:hypothetical protein